MRDHNLAGKLGRMLKIQLIVCCQIVLVSTLLAGCLAIPAQSPPAVAPNFSEMSAPLPSPSEATVAVLPRPAATPVEPEPVFLPTPTPTATSEPQSPAADRADTESQQFAVGNELTIAALRSRDYAGSDVVIEQTLANGANYAQHIASYMSDGNKIYGLLTVPFGEVPEGGFPAIVFIHGYIPPSVYRTTERYVAYVDALARNGFVVFKIDLRGFGNSEGEPTGAYFSPAYTTDALTALKSLQRLDYVDPDGIGMWGHSMAGNVVLRSMLVGEPSGAEVKAGVVWAGAVYSYEDMVRYAIDDPSFRREDQPTIMRTGAVLRETYGPPNLEVPYWRAVSLTENIEYLDAPLQIHHAVDDDVVNIGYSEDLAATLDEAGKPYEFYRYEGGGHNINSPYFSDAMQRTIEFFRAHL